MPSSESIVSIVSVHAKIRTESLRIQVYNVTVTPASSFCQFCRENKKMKRLITLIFNQTNVKIQTLFKSAVFTREQLNHPCIIFIPPVFWFFNHHFCFDGPRFCSLSSRGNQTLETSVLNWDAVTQERPTDDSIAARFEFHCYTNKS